MSKCCVIFLILFWEVCQKADAQIWSKNDSIRLANILSGKDTFRINPEFQRAIKNGTFINTEPVGKMRMSHSSLPITKDFSEYIKLDRKALSNAEHSTIKNAPDFKGIDSPSGDACPIRAGNFGRVANQPEGIRHPFVHHPRGKIPFVISHFRCQPSVVLYVELLLSPEVKELQTHDAPAVPTASHSGNPAEAEGVPQSASRVGHGEGFCQMNL